MLDLSSPIDGPKLRNDYDPAGRYNRARLDNNTFRKDDTKVMLPDDGSVRIDVLQRLAELAMSDEAFRAIARDDLPAALEKYGYELTASELALVLRFRRSLAEAGVDLDLVDGIGDERVAEVLEKLQRRVRESGLHS